MNVQKTTQSPTKLVLTITADEADLSPIRTMVLQHLAKEVKLQGFRQGKAPLALVEKNVDQQKYYDHFLNDALNDLYGTALRNERIRAVGSPEVTLTKFVPFTQLEFKAEVEAIGDIQLPDYTKTKLEKTVIAIKAQDVDDVIESLRLRMAEKNDVERAAKDGDQVWIDFTGTDSKGKPVSGADGKDYPLALGSKTFIPGFEENLVGLKAGDEKTFTVTFPADYGAAALQNQKVTFAVTVNKVQEVVKPAIDDALAAKAGPFKTVQELKDDIKKQLKQERQGQADRDFEDQLIREITTKSTIEIPESLITSQLISMEEDEKRNLVYRGQTWQEHLESEGVTEEQHRERHKPQAEERVKAGIVLSEIADKEGLTVTPEELEIRIQVLKGQYQDKTMQAELDKPENRQDIYSRILTEKTIAKLVEYISK